MKFTNRVAVTVRLNQERQGQMDEIIMFWSQHGGHSTPKDALLFAFDQLVTHTNIIKQKQKEAELLDTSSSSDSSSSEDVETETQAEETSQQPA